MVTPARVEAKLYGHLSDCSTHNEHGQADCDCGSLRSGEVE
jgi:hypothetical protein